MVYICIYIFSFSTTIGIIMNQTKPLTFFSSWLLITSVINISLPALTKP